MENNKRKCITCGKEFENLNEFEMCTICKEKEVLRDDLFAKFFEREPNRIKISNLKEQILDIAKVWENLNDLLKTAIKDYKWFNSVEKVRFVTIQNTIYLIIKVRMFKYLIVDVKKKQVLTKKEISNQFSKHFFEENFEEYKDKLHENNWGMYYFLKSKNEISSVINFCLENREILELSSNICCKLKIGEACIYFSMRPSNRTTQLSFLTPNQYLYETIFFDMDLTPSVLDTKGRIRKEKIQEIVSKINDIEIPKECIPEVYLKGEIQTRERTLK